jgi:hypothetical protein
MLLANVNGIPHRASSGLIGVCRACGESVIAKCGSIVVHHWAHKVGSECDSFSEQIGEWHLSWQDMIRTEFVEVVMAPHRADITGNGGMVVELQHSPLSIEEIAEREAFYGQMVWLFDATHRFRMVESGDLVFFAFGRSKHISHCKTPVFLDFGDTVVEVLSFTGLFPNCSGYGMKRDRLWFIQEHLSETVNDPLKIEIARSTDYAANPWETKCPYYKTKHPTPFADPSTGQTVLLPKGTPYIDMDFKFTRRNPRPISDDVIDHHPEIANGWTKKELLTMKKFLHAKEMIFDGKLRLMPAQADILSVNVTVSNAETLVHQVESHIKAGRIPILKDETKRKIIESAQRHEQHTYGHLLSEKRKEPPSLF